MIIALLFGLATAAPIVLPPPSGDPQAIVLADDPLLRFAHATAPAAPFLERVGHAVEVHPDVAAAIAAAQASEGVRTEVRGRLFPQVQAQVVAARALARDFGDRTTIVESLSPRARNDAVVQGSQLLFDFGATGNRIAAADDRILAAKAEVERVAGDTALRAVTAWYEVLGYQALLAIGSASVTRQHSIRDDVSQRIAQGLGTTGDLARADAGLAEAEAQASRFGRRLAQARARYHELFGNDPPAEVRRALPPRSQANDVDAAEALSRRSPAVAAALRRAEAARRDYRAVRADGLPRLSAGIDARRYDIPRSNDYEIRGTIVLTQSLSAGGSQRGRIQQAGGQARQAGFIADQAVAESERDAGIAFTDIASLQETEAALERSYVANRRARDSYVEQFRVSRGSLIELLRIEQDYVTAAGNYLQGVIELDVARYTLLVRTGEILPAVGVSLTAAPS